MKRIMLTMAIIGASAFGQATVRYDKLSPDCSGLNFLDELSSGCFWPRVRVTAHPENPKAAGVFHRLDLSRFERQAKRNDASGHIPQLGGRLCRYVLCGRSPVSKRQRFRATARAVSLCAMSLVSLKTSKNNGGTTPPISGRSARGRKRINLEGESKEGDQI